MRLQALPYLRDWVMSKILPTDKEHLRGLLKNMGRHTSVEEGKLWKVVEKGDGDSKRLEILDVPKRLQEVLHMCHKGMGHRQLRSVLRHFRTRFWVPGAATLIKRHILSYKVCQAFSNAKVSAGPGMTATARDVFTHWSIDFAGLFPKDVETGCQYVIIAVEWVTCWAEAEATLDATAETAATFLYNRVICRYGCIESLQSDNGTHFANEVIRCLTDTLCIRHHFSTPYYPQSNGRLERVIGTL